MGTSNTSLPRQMVDAYLAQMQEYLQSIDDRNVSLRASLDAAEANVVKEQARSRDIVDNNLEDKKRSMETISGLRSQIEAARAQATRAADEARADRERADEKSASEHQIAQALAGARVTNEQLSSEGRRKDQQIADLEKNVDQQEARLLRIAKERDAANGQWESARERIRLLETLEDGLDQAEARARQANVERDEQIKLLAEAETKAAKHQRNAEQADQAFSQQLTTELK